MTNNELIGLAEREAQRLTDENDHSAATLMRELCERLRGSHAINVDARGADAAVVARVVAALNETVRRNPNALR